jgi:hypothetical protein
MSQNRRIFFKFAMLGTIGAFAGQLAEAAVRKFSAISRKEFLVLSELTTQQDALIDSIIKKNPGHIKLSESDLDALRVEGRQILTEVFAKLTHEELSEEDMNEIALHLSQPAEKKWQRFHKLAVERSRAAYISKVEDAIKKSKA